MQRKKPIVQDYAAYTTEDFHVWKLLFERQMELLKDYASPLYLSCIEKVNFNAGEIPHFEKTNALLKELTGWQLTVVPELVPQKEFFELLAQRIFPATCWLRTMAELDYIEEPDMFHDVFGHVPLLANEAYANFMEGFGKLALQWIDVPEAISLLGRIYWFTIEFGLLGNGADINIYGAGILSSIEECHSAVGVHSKKYDFDIDTLLSTAYRTDVLQDKYFVIASFEQLYESLAEIDKIVRGYIDVDIIQKYAALVASDDSM